MEVRIGQKKIDEGTKKLGREKEGVCYISSNGIGPQHGLKEEIRIKYE